MPSEVVRTWPGSNGRVYEFRQTDGGEVWCTCKGWVFSKARPRSCKHLVEWAESIVKGAAIFDTSKRTK